MSLKTVKLPNVGDFKDLPIIEILVNKGDQIEDQHPLFIVESDKATMEIPSDCAGQVQNIQVKIGDVVNIGDALLTLNTKDTSPETITKTSEKQTKVSTPAVETTAVSAQHVATEIPQQENKAPPSTETVYNKQPYAKTYHASPKIRQFANRLGVNLEHVQGSGKHGRITQEDVEQWIKGTLQQTTATVNQPSISAIEIDYSQFGEVSKQALSRIQHLSAQHLHQAWQALPHVTQHHEVIIDELEAFRKQVNQTAPENQAKLTQLAFYLKACAKTLTQHPRFNAAISHDLKTLTLKHYIHIGFAVDTPDGLLVPVIKNVDQKGLIEIAKEIIELAHKARQGKLTTNDMQGGCFTISSLGGIGGHHFTPIINAPEVAILGVGRMQIKPYWDGDSFIPKQHLPLSLSYDHRVIDGAAGAKFIVSLGQYLNDLKHLIL